MHMTYCICWLIVDVNECGFGMPSDSLGKSLMFTRESGKTFVDILLGSAKGK